MADYYSILKKTIGSLPENTGAARRSVYSRARNAIVSQLKAYDPPLSPSEITAEQLRLEEAIRKVEAEAARASLGLSPAATSPAPSAGAAVGGVEHAPAPADTAHTAAASPLKETVEEAGRLGAASHKAVQSTREVVDPEAEAELSGRHEPVFVQQHEPAGYADEGPEQGEWDGAQEAPHVHHPVHTDHAEGDEGAQSPRAPRPRISDTFAENKRRLPIVPIALFGVLVLIALGIAGVIYSQKDNISEMMAGGSETTDNAPVPETAATPAGNGDVASPAPQADEPEADNNSTKNADRLLDDNGEPAAAPDARTVTTTTITPGSPAPRTVGADTPQPTEQPAAPEPAAPTTPTAAPAQPVEAPDSVLASGNTPEAAPAETDANVKGERSILYEEGLGNGGAGTASNGQVVWSVEEESDLEGRKQSVLTASVKVPERNVSVDIRIKPNEDASLPASHLVEIKYDFPKDFPSGDVQNVPGLVMKPTEQARGDALIGASVKVSDGYFWIALSSIASEMERNMGLLRERGWIDIPMLYNNGKRGILTLEKGPTGTKAVEQAVQAWQGS